VEQVRAGSPAEKAGMKSDDLIVLLGDRLIQSCKIFQSSLEYVDAYDSVRITVQRGNDLMEFTLSGEQPKKVQP
jgi:S1-C subfamily serine protease